MIGMQGPPVAFDDVFYIAQLALLAGWLVALFTVRLQRSVRWRRGAALVVALVGAVFLPAIWNEVYPPFNGLEGTARIFFGFPLAVINSVLSCAWSAASSTDARGPRWPALWPFVITAALGLAVWVRFILH
jgi:hypothetical protein